VRRVLIRMKTLPFPDWTNKIKMLSLSSLIK
jgi:hypothetical protein